MPQVCVRCRKRRGARACRALSGLICSRCCGEDRLVRVACPADCPHLGAHEGFQREKQGARYREAWAKTNADLREREGDLEVVLELEYLLKRVADRMPGATYADVAGAIGEFLPRLGSIELVSRPFSPFARLLWDELRTPLEEGDLSREQVKEGLTRLGKLVDLLRDPEAPRGFLQGLFAHLARFLREEPKKAEERTGLIITPSDLRHAP